MPKIIVKWNCGSQGKRNIGEKEEKKETIITNKTRGIAVDAAMKKVREKLLSNFRKITIRVLRD